MGLGSYVFLQLCWGVLMAAYGYVGGSTIRHLYGLNMVWAMVILSPPAILASWWFGQQLAKMDNEE